MEGERRKYIILKYKQSSKKSRNDFQSILILNNLREFFWTILENSIKENIKYVYLSINTNLRGLRIH